MALKQATQRVGWATDDHIDWQAESVDTDTVTIPDVKGWRVMVQPLGVHHKSAGGIHFSDDTIQKEQLVVSIGRVLSMGEQAYGREDMGDPWCKVGDLVGFGKYAGKKLVYRSIPLIVLNDDEIIMTFPDSQEDASE